MRSHLLSLILCLQPAGLLQCPLVPSSLCNQFRQICQFREIILWAATHSATGEFQTGIFLSWRMHLKKKRVQGTKWNEISPCKLRETRKDPLAAVQLQCRKSAESTQTSTTQTRKSHNPMKECAGGRYNKTSSKAQLQELPRRTGHPG